MRAVVFDMDGVLVDSEQLWDEVRRGVVTEHGGTWAEGATRTLQGMSTPEWSEYLVRELGAQLTPEEAAARVIDEMRRRYEGGPPVIEGAAETLRAVSGRWPAAIASSAPPVLIDSLLSATGLTERIPVVVSSEEVAAGKPAPDVYHEAARRLGVPAGECAAVEDSTSGLRAALAAGMTVYAVPNPHFPPDDEVLGRTHHVLGAIGDLPATLGL
ncbi:HAD family hydrolase [Prauserella rugosa]|uniref:HAD superfamily hydrolase (TIGR01509 family) n=1 Tax=Prauserella rugosa TaxID=43354 RepID=A0A660CKE2_9PSEU|nr:HAD family phosphatase [Prauserella rugosa]KMS91462.1 HAD family hydrolase [Streptomyces regensis]TWH21631.1 HAD superfamily hydrolase (TIGR01509 family) [Prauserella rugosa]